MFEKATNLLEYETVISVVIHVRSFFSILQDLQDFQDESAHVRTLEDKLQISDISAQWLSGWRTWNSNSVTRFYSRVVPLSHWVTTLGKLFTHIASQVSQLQEVELQKGSFRRLSGYGD